MAHPGPGRLLPHLRLAQGVEGDVPPTHWHHAPGTGGLQGLQPGLAGQAHQPGGGPQGKGGSGGGEVGSSCWPSAGGERHSSGHLLQLALM